MPRNFAFFSLPRCLCENIYFSFLYFNIWVWRWLLERINWRRHTVELLSMRKPRKTVTFPAVVGSKRKLFDNSLTLRQQNSLSMMVKVCLSVHSNYGGNPFIWRCTIEPNWKIMKIAFCINYMCESTFS